MVSDETEIIRFLCKRWLQIFMRCVCVCVFWLTINLYIVSLWVTCILFSLSGCCSYLCGPEATGFNRHTFIHAGHCLSPETLPHSWLWLPYKTPSPGLYLAKKKGKKNSNIDSYSLNKLQRSFRGDCLTVRLLCSSTSLPSHRSLYLPLSVEIRKSLLLSATSPHALWTNAIIFTESRMPFVDSLWIYCSQ